MEVAELIQQNQTTPTVEFLMPINTEQSETPPAGSNEEGVIDLAGYQVTRGEFFAHTREPAITIWPDKIKFNMACLRKFPGVTYIQVLIHPEQKRLIIRPCKPDTPESIRWARGGEKKEIMNRDMICRIFAGRVFDLMGWDAKYRYKILGTPASSNGEGLFLFRLSDFELFVSNKKGSYLPEDWKKYFGVPFEEHEDEYKINLADGYITTDKA
jgi:hypothetical protein